MYPNFDHSVLDYTFVTDEIVVFTAIELGIQQLYKVIRNNPVEKLIDSEFISSFGPILLK